MGLMIHAGGRLATRQEVEAVPTPDPVHTHHPIPHTALLDTVARHVRGVGWYVTKTEYALSSGDAHMFALWRIADGSTQEDYALVLGIRNAHDKKFSASCAVGNVVFVCDNLAFASDVVVSRKHTKYIMRDLDRLVAHTFGRLMQLRIDQAQRIHRYKHFHLSNERAHDLLIRAYDARVMPAAQIPKVLEAWRRPLYDEFKPRTAWSLLNAFTHVAKDTNPHLLVRRTTRLHGLLDMITAQSEN